MENFLFVAPSSAPIMHLEHKAVVEEIDFSIGRGLDHNQVQRLAELDFVAELKDMFITGSTGTGITKALRIKQEYYESKI